MKINKELIWDYEFEPNNFNSAGFKKWYIARVLTKGTIKDIKEVGLETIYKYLPAITLPLQIREFWEWYFSTQEVQKRYEHINREPESY
ncbi:MAG: hypothetical protein QMD71_05545 [bacterium]|nr:hypothetical protein [bacterium]